MTLRTFPAKANAGPPIVSGAVAIRASAALGATYEYTDSLNVIGVAQVILDLTWDQSDETSIEVCMQHTNSGGDVSDASASWFDTTVKDTPSSGVASVYPESLTLANANFADPNKITLPPIDVTGLERVRFGFKKTGGAGVVTLGVTARAGQLAVPR